MRVRPSAVESMLAVQPAARVAAVKAISAVSQLPKEWKLDTYEHARRCLTTLAPGHWTEGHVVGLVMQATQFASEPAAAYQPPNPAECVNALAESVQLQETLLDPWPVQNEGMQALWRTEELTVQPVSTKPVEALRPSAYKAWQAGPEPWTVATSPSVYVVDLVLFLVSLMAPTVLAVLVPATYVTHAPKGRVEALRRLSAAGRVGCVKCPKSEECFSVDSLWICVFKDAPTMRVYGFGVSVLELPAA